MIEVKPHQSGHKNKTYYLTIDGQDTGEARTSISVRNLLTDGSTAKAPEGIFKVIVLDPELSRTLLEHPVSNVSPTIHSIEFRIDYPIPHLPEIVYDIGVRREDSRGFELLLGYYFNYDQWKKLWTTKEYKQELVRVINDSPGIKWEGNLEASFYEDNFFVLFKVENTDSPILTEVKRRLEVIDELHKAAESSLMWNLRRDSVVMQFDFPEEVRVPCEQYLLYFGQFLKDLGVEAKAEIEHKAGQVLFAVTPADKQTALDKIRTALDTYLQLPSNPTAGDASMIEYEVAAQRLAANVDHLKGQLRLAHAELRLASATMQAQQVTIDRLLSADVIVESLKDVTPKPKDEDKEELLGGTVALTKTNWKGVEFNLPEIFRRLRRMFKEEK